MGTIFLVITILQLCKIQYKRSVVLMKVYKNQEEQRFVEEEERAKEKEKRAIEAGRRMTGHTKKRSTKKRADE